MKHLRQPTTLLNADLPAWLRRQAEQHIKPGQNPPWCGHYCLMMVADITFEHACVLTSQIGGTNKNNLLAALGRMKIKARWVNAPHVSIKSHQCAIAHIFSDEDKNWSHWLVMDDARVYDPARENMGWFLPDCCHVSGYIEIDKETIKVQVEDG